MSKKKAAKKRTPIQQKAPQATFEATTPQAKAPVAAQPRVASAPKTSGKPLPVSLVSAQAIAQAQASFGEEYRYVLGDLKRIGAIAAGMFVLLVALALIVR